MAAPHPWLVDWPRVAEIALRHHFNLRCSFLPTMERAHTDLEYLAPQAISTFALDQDLPRARSLLATGAAQ